MPAGPAIGLSKHKPRFLAGFMLFADKDFELFD